MFIFACTYNPFDL